MPLSNRSKGLLLTISGITLLLPDTLLIRLAGLEDWKLIFWRTALAAFMFGSYLLVTCLKQKSFDCLKIGLSGLFVSLAATCGNFTFVMSIQQTKVANVLIIIALSPMFTALVDWIFLKQRLARQTWIATIACLFGVIIMVADGIGTGSHLGNLLALLTAVILGIEFSALGATRKNALPAALFFGYLTASLIAASLTPNFAIPAANLAPVIFMGLVIVPISFFLLSKGPQYIPAPEVTLFLLLETVIGPLLVWLFLGEDPGQYALIGGGIVITTLVLHSAYNLIWENRTPGRSDPGGATEITQTISVQ